MDERNNRAHRKSGSSSSPSKQQQTKFAKWGSGSKFNKILNNIERSILAQFGGPSSSNWSDPHPERHHHHQSRNNHDSLSAQPNTSGGLDQVSPPTKIKSTTSTKSANNKLKPNSSNQSLGAQRDAAHHQPNQTMDRVTSELQQRGGDSKSATLAASTSQPMPANRNGKMILNKYQQQIAAAMQTNKSLPSSAISAGKQSGGGTASSYSHNRLSIPPPHANDEARNQNHRFLLGCPSTQSSDFNTANDQMASIYDQGRVALPTSKHSAADRQSALFYHNSASPASSAQSLPVTKTGFTQPTQDRSRIDATDDEESGFCTSRSRCAAMNVPPSANRFPNDAGKPENSMIFFQANQPQPMGNLTNIKTSTLSPQQQQYQRQQQMFHQNNLFQSRLMQQQSMNNTQQQQMNQVPISQGVMYNSNMKVQYHQNANRPGDFRNPTYGSYGHLGPVPYSQVSLQQQHPPQPLYDGQIYANAPPKPRRYQYYNPSLNFNRNSAALSKAPQNYPPNPATQFISQQVVATPGHQYSSQQVPQLYNQQRNELINASGSHVPYGPQRQLPMLPHPPTLTKSKSSLDVANLSRFKQDSMLRVQPHCSNVPIYGSTRLINQIESSTLQRNPNRQPTIESNLQQQQSTHLQRSKSIGNLMPDYNTHGLNITQRNLAPFSTANHHLPLQQSNALAYPKFLTVSSASTSNLNYMDSSPTMLMNTSTHSSRQASQTMQEITRQDGNNANNSIQTQQQYLATQKNPLSPMYQNHQRLFNNGGSLACRPNQHQNRGATYYNNGDGDTIKPNINTVSNSGKVAREAQNGSISYAMPPADGTSVVAQSLDDKIRHLLIGDDSTSGAGAISKSNKTESPRQVAAWHAQQPSHSLITKQSQLSQEETPSTQLKPSTSKLFLNKQPSIEPENDEKLASEEIHHPNADMGNRHQRQYQVAGGSSGGYPDQETMIDHRNNGNHFDSLSTNSQLIVDLTTPRVLAKTQTTLLPISSHTTNPQTSIVQQSKPQEAWSMNQLGLPTRYVEQCVQNSQLSSQYGNPEVQNKIEATAASNFSAPYYYSDLKSEEQRRALFNIVQQKSLSPPPQLLSRSIDQSNTRLAPKSATMHAAQARMLSETLAASHRQLQLRTSLADSKSATNLTGISSNSTVAKNIDKLFESPVDPMLNQTVQNKLYSVQSMLTLSNNPTAQESCSMISSEQIQVESLSNSSGYCSDALKKTGSKSKSLENISQQQLQLSHNVTASVEKTNVGERLKQHGNPVYENIRRSDKLLSAINNSTTCLSTSSTRNRKPRSSLPPTRPQPTSGSDSMDSILGSSFDEVDDESEENPADFDSDTSVTGIDFIKLSPTTADMSELIEQLKNNHSKLTDEYKSTLARISKILNRKDSSGKRKISEKLASRLQRLEQKSKKCESRSKNQLALIQMMEKAIRQSQQESPDKSSANKTAAGQHDATESLALVDAAHNKTNDSNDLIECPQTDQTSSACPSTSPRQSSDHQDADHKSDRHSSSEPKQPPPPPPPVLEAQNAIKAIVTEATSVEVPRKFVAELCNQQTQPRDTLANKTDEPVSLSTRFQQNKTQDRASKDNHSRPKSDGTVGQRIQIIESIVKRNGTNPFKSDKPDSPVGATLNNGGAQTKRRNSGAFHDELGDDEDDFIEFLSTGSSSTHGRSQFESSQFSASDFNNSSSSGSTSVSSHSGSVTTDSLDLSSPSVTTKSEQADNRSKNSVGILKSGSPNSKSPDDKSHKKEHSSSTNNNSEDEHSKIYQKSNGNNSSSKRDEKARGDNKFKNVLGNVIDVDVYPVNTNHPAASS